MKKLTLLSMMSMVLAGCATSNPSAVSGQRKAVMCTGCQSVWVASNAPAGKPGMFTMGPTHQHRACPYCSEMARKYLSTGEMVGTCPKCGKSMRACTVELRPAPQKKSS
jgi:hypothetical protein